jgi:hypothetical protein
LHPKLTELRYNEFMKMLVTLIFFLCFQCFAQSLPSIKAIDLVSGKTLQHSWNEAKNGSVLVFLSSSCPCSHAHIGHLIDLAKAYPEMKFIGVHSNANESVIDSEKYFKSLNLLFPVIQDDSTKWADRLKAYRTPHAFIVTTKGELAYQGGVTSSADPEKADSFYLKVTLKKFLAGEKIESSRTRVLGCQIARK